MSGISLTDGQERFLRRSTYDTSITDDVAIGRLVQRLEAERDRFVITPRTADLLWDAEQTIKELRRQLRNEVGG